MKLELGCGSSPRTGAVNHDRTMHDGVDVAHDLNLIPWPWADNEFSEIRAIDVMEHLHLEVAEWMDELWRISAPGCHVILRLPAWDNPLSYRDPTHQRVFHPDTLRYWDPSTEHQQHFGRHYFDTGKWWTIHSVVTENADIRTTMSPIK